MGVRKPPAIAITRSVDNFVFRDEARGLAEKLRKRVVAELKAVCQVPDRLEIVLLRPVDLRFYYPSTRGLHFTDAYRRAFARGNARDAREWRKRITQFSDPDVERFIGDLAEGAGRSPEAIVGPIAYLHDLHKLRARYRSCAAIEATLRSLLAFVGQEWNEGLCGEAFNQWIVDRSWRTIAFPGYSSNPIRQPSPSARTFPLMQRIEDLFGIYHVPKPSRAKRTQECFFVAPIIQESMVLGMLFAVYDKLLAKDYDKTSPQIREILDLAVIEQTSGEAVQFLIRRETELFQDLTKAIRGNADTPILSLLCDQMHNYVNAAMCILWQVDENRAVPKGAWGRDPEAAIPVFARMPLQNRGLSSFPIKSPPARWRRLASYLVKATQNGLSPVRVPSHIMAHAMDQSFVKKYKVQAGGVELTRTTWLLLPFVQGHTHFVAAIATPENVIKRVFRLTAWLRLLDTIAMSTQAQDWMDIAAAESHSITNYAVGANFSLKKAHRDGLLLLKSLSQLADEAPAEPSAIRLGHRLLGNITNCHSYNQYMYDYARFFEEFANTMRIGPGGAVRDPTEMDLVEFVKDTFENAKDCLIAGFSEKQEARIAKIRAFQCVITTSDFDTGPTGSREDAGFRTIGKPALLRFAFHELAKNAMTKGRSPVIISIQPDTSSGGRFHWRVRFTNEPQDQLPSAAESREILFRPRRHEGASLGCFLIRYFFRNFYGGNLDIIESEVDEGRFSIELVFPREFRTPEIWLEDLP